MDIGEFKNLWVNHKQAHADFMEIRKRSRELGDKLYKEKYSLFRAFDGIEWFPDGYIDIIPITIMFKGSLVAFHMLKFNVRDGEIKNIYFKNIKGDLLKFGEILSFFDDENQIDNLVDIFEMVSDSLR